MRREAPPERIMAASIECSRDPVKRQPKKKLTRSGDRLALALKFFVRGGGCIAAHGNEFRGDADGDFFRRKRANFEAHGRKNAVELFRLETVGFKRFVGREHFSFAANHADVARVGAHGPGEHAHVFLVAARDDDEIRRRVRAKLCESRFEIREDLLGHRKSVAIGELFAIVNDDDAEARRAGGSCDGHRNVAAAKKISDRLRKNRFDENFERAAADQAVVEAGFVVQIEDHFARRFAFHHFARRGPDVGFHAAAANRADDSAVFAHEHARAFKAGNGAVGVDNRGEGSALPRAPHADDFFKDVHEARLRRASSAVNPSLWIPLVLNVSLNCAEENAMTGVGRRFHWMQGLPWYWRILFWITMADFVVGWALMATISKWAQIVPDAEHPVELKMKFGSFFYLSPRLGWFMNNYLWIFFGLFVLLTLLTFTNGNRLRRVR